MTTDLQYLGDELGVSERTLRMALNEGTLHATRPSPRRLTITADEKHYLRRSWDLLAALRQILRTEHNVRFALLFGSAARGIKLEELLGRSVDILTLDDAEAAPHILASASTEGRVLVDREGRWAQLRAEADTQARRAQRQYRRRKERALAGIDRMLAT
jgi:predicted nucleotidyltransferase